jgi:hypothetical protein
MSIPESSLLIKSCFGILAFFGYKCSSECGCIIPKALEPAGNLGVIGDTCSEDELPDFELQLRVGEFMYT